MVDANYKFITIYVSSYMREGDNDIFIKSNMNRKVLNGSFGFVKNIKLSEKVLPHVILEYETFRFT